MPHTTKIGTAFVPVSDLERAARWYEHAFGFQRRVLNGFSAWLEGPTGGASLTLMGPQSGIAASPGLDWATCNLIVDELDAVHRRLTSEVASPSPIDGDPDICRFFTLRDPDGNQVLVADR